MVLLIRIHGTVKLHGSAGIPCVVIIDFSRKLLPLGIDDPAPCRQDVSEGAIVPAGFLASYHTVLIEFVAVAGGKSCHKISADNRRAVCNQICKAAEFASRTIGRGGIKGRTYPQLLILHVHVIV